jgi:hypothetical protein
LISLVGRFDSEVGFEVLEGVAERFSDEMRPVLHILDGSHHCRYILGSVLSSVEGRQLKSSNIAGVIGPVSILAGLVAILPHFCILFARLRLLSSEFPLCIPALCFCELSKALLCKFHLSGVSLLSTSPVLKQFVLTHLLDHGGTDCLFGSPRFTSFFFLMLGLRVVAEVGLLRYLHKPATIDLLLPIFIGVNSSYFAESFDGSSCSQVEERGLSKQWNIVLGGLCLDVDLNNPDFLCLPFELPLGSHLLLDFPDDLGPVEDLGVIGRDVGYSALHDGDLQRLTDAEVAGPQVDPLGSVSRPVLLLPADKP